jgi:orotate phosphoribosyltransferase
VTAQANETARQIVRLLVKAGAIHVSQQQPFVLASGWASPVYVDCRVLIGNPDIRHAVIEIAAQHMAGLSTRFDAVAGGETAGIPFATSLAEKHGLAMRYVRKRPLGIGRNAQVEGGSVEGLRVLLVDDLITDGTSKLAFIRGLRSGGAVVEHSLSIFFNNAFPGAIERLKRVGVFAHALATWTDVLRSDAGLAPADRATIENFLSDPIAWSARHGGRIARA